MASKYYAIKVGNGVTNKIVRTWEECKAMVDHYPSIYKSFKTEEEAKEYLGTIKDVSKKLEDNKKAKDYNINRRKSTVSVANVLKGMRIDKELMEEFESKCIEFGVEKEKMIIELMREWIN